MTLQLEEPLEPMEARLVEKIPADEGWQYEPKWDGFRCVAFRDRERVELQSKSGQPLTRYFPEVVQALLTLREPRFVLDGEIVVPEGQQLSFDSLLQRIHPAASRVRKLAAETPALYIVFDLLQVGAAESLIEAPLAQRRRRLEAFALAQFKDGGIRLSPCTTNVEEAGRWFGKVGGALDGVMAKRLDSPYLPGSRDSMVKIKCIRTADCVVGGFRYGTRGHSVGSLLLGLYNAEGLLDHVGFCSGIKEAERAPLTALLEKHIEPPGFSGHKPGGPSRWSNGRSEQWSPLKPTLVVEVSYDHFTGGRFRHGTGLLRWRPDKSAKQCTMEQVRATAETASLKLLNADALH